LDKEDYISNNNFCFTSLGFFIFEYNLSYVQNTQLQYSKKRKFK